MNIWVILGSLAVVACGSSTSNEGEKACTDLQAKFDQCHLVMQGACNSSQPCAVECAAKADCSQLKASPPTGSYLDCVAACSGAGPDDFVCKDGKAFVNQAAVCDGKHQCQDGSDEANCGSSDAGVGGASSGSGGGPGTGGAAGSGGGGGMLSSGGAGGSANVDGGSSSACEAMVAHELSECPTVSTDVELAQCKRDTLTYDAEGCGTAWSAYASCVLSSPFSCDLGPTGCDTQQNGYFACQSRFVARTGCDRLTSQDVKCGAAAPYGFGCLSTVPSQCVTLPPTGGATIACCPAFPPP